MQICLNGRIAGLSIAGMKTRIKFRLQASTNTEIGGWQNTKFVSVYLPEVEREFVKLASDPSRWIDGKIGDLRIVRIEE